MQVKNGYVSLEYSGGYDDKHQFVLIVTELCPTLDAGSRTATVILTEDEVSQLAEQVDRLMSALPPPPFFAAPHEPPR